MDTLSYSQEISNISQKKLRLQASDLSNSTRSDTLFNKSIDFSSKNYILKDAYFDIKDKEDSFGSCPIKQSIKSPILSYYFFQAKEVPISISKTENITNCDTFCQTSNISNFNFGSLFSNKKDSKPSKNFRKKAIHKIEISLTRLKANPEVIAKQLKTQQWCRYYQSKIAQDLNYANEFLYPSLNPFMIELVTSQFANYLYQQIFDILNDTNLNHFLNFISNNFHLLAVSEYGTRVIQHIEEKINHENENGKKILEMFLRNIIGNVEKMSLSEGTSHIIQKFLKAVKNTPYSNQLFKEIYDSFLNIARSKFGCCVIQKCISYGDNQQKSNIMSLIFKNTDLIINNQFGNYIYQSLILSADESLIRMIYQILSKKIILYCKKKYSSNVIERLFDIHDKDFRSEIAKSLLKEESKIIELMCNQYGNYIIQKILDCTNDEVLIEKILLIITKNVGRILRMSFGKKLLVNLHQRYPVLKLYMC